MVFSRFFGKCMMCDTMLTVDRTGSIIVLDKKLKRLYQDEAKDAVYIMRYIQVSSFCSECDLVFTGPEDANNVEKALRSFKETGFKEEHHFNGAIITKITPEELEAVCDTKRMKYANL